jgi:hypothetical protein
LKCSELARVVAAQAVAQTTVWEERESVAVRLTSTITCPDFTVRLRMDREVRAMRAGDRELQRLPDGSLTLEPFTWCRAGDEIAWCADLPAGELTVSAS